MEGWAKEFITLYGPLGMGWIVSALLARVLYIIIKNQLEHVKNETAAKLELANAIREMKETINALASR